MQGAVVFSFDDDMIVTPHLSNLVGHESPAFHYRRCQQDGIFDRFTMHVNALWADARPVRDLPRLPDQIQSHKLLCSGTWRRKYPAW